MKVSILPVTPLQQNCAILECEQTRHAALVDPGGDSARIVQVLEEAALTCEKIFVTHAHADHAGSVAFLQQHFGVPVEGPHRGRSQLGPHARNPGKNYGRAGRDIIQARSLARGG